MVCECKGSEDGNKLLVTASSDGNIQVWSVNPYDAKPVSTYRWAYRHVKHVLLCIAAFKFCKLETIPAM